MDITVRWWISGFSTLKDGKPLIFDATHSVQQPGVTVNPLETDRWPYPYKAALQLESMDISKLTDPTWLYDGPNSLYLKEFEQNVPRLLNLYDYLKTILIKQ